jgi:hypothetical protein
MRGPDIIERGAEAMRAKRRELINQPLDRIWPDLMRVAVEAMREPFAEIADRHSYEAAQAIRASLSLRGVAMSRDEQARKLFQKDNSAIAQRDRREFKSFDDMPASLREWWRQRAELYAAEGKYGLPPLPPSCGVVG